MHRSTHIFTSDGSDILIAKPQLGFNPADTMRQFQVSCSGLGGGTYTVSFVPAGSSHLIEFAAGLLETELTLSAGDGFLYDAMIISFAGLPGGSTPEVCATFFTKGL
jgi:hypothetical protein